MRSTRISNPLTIQKKKNKTNILEILYLKWYNVIGVGGKTHHFWCVFYIFFCNKKGRNGRMEKMLKSNSSRSFLYDNFRGVLMLSIPISHFTKSGAMWYQTLYEPGFAQHSLCGLVYITINVFVMQAFMFLSGYFSKNTEKAAKTSVKGILWPYIVFATIWMVAGHVFGLYGYRNCSILTPPFAMWFLFCLFIYRFTLKYVVKFKYALPASIVMMFLAGILPFNDFLALGRLFSYYPFFLIGYYLSKENMEKILDLRKKKVFVIALGVILIAISVLLTLYGPRPSWYLLKANAETLQVPLLTDQLMRLLLMFVASGWIIFMLNILPKGKNFLTHVGMNTMPVYMFHLPLRQVYRLEGIYICVAVTLAVALISLISVTHAKRKDWELTSRLIGILGFIILIVYCARILEPFIELCPENKIVFYALTFGSALLAGISFTAPVWVRVYSIMTDGLLTIFATAKKR